MRGTPDITYYVAASADGFIATADGGVAWLSEVAGGGDYGYAEFYAGIEAVVLGRVTYEQVLGFGDWPYAGKAGWVLSRRELPSPPAGVTVSALEPREFAAQLAASGVERAWLVGGGELAGSFARAGLITRYIVTVMPVLLGAGVKLLGERGATVRLTLESSERRGGATHLVYLA
jgi:dihydrofolate reductase